MTEFETIIDCDPGCDDAIALVSALTNPNIKVVGITSIGGNVDPHKTKRNAIGIADLVGRRDVPIVAGAMKPLVKPAVNASDVHGETGVDGLTMNYNAITRLEAEQPKMSAAEFILEQSHKLKGRLNLIVIGPMTNIALALQQDPNLPTRIRSLTVMGCAFGNPTGNIGENLQAEFNIYCDPHAAKITLDAFQNSRVPTKIMPLDVTHRFMQDHDFREWLAAQSAGGTNFASMLEHYADGYPGLEPTQKGMSPLHDFHTVAATLQPSIYQWERGRVDIVPDLGAANEGQSVFTPSAKGVTEIARGLNKERFSAILKDSLVNALH